MIRRGMTFDELSATLRNVCTEAERLEVLRLVKADPATIAGFGLIEQHIIDTLVSDLASESLAPHRSRPVPHPFDDKAFARKARPVRKRGRGR